MHPDLSVVLRDFQYSNHHLQDFTAQHFLLHLKPYTPLQTRSQSTLHTASIPPKPVMPDSLDVKKPRIQVLKYDTSKLAHMSVVMLLEAHLFVVQASHSLICNSAILARVQGNGHR